MTTQKRSIKWRKASYSDQGNGCVELANSLDLVRDSKNPGGPVLVADVSTLLAGVKAGRFER